VTFDILSAT